MRNLASIQKIIDIQPIPGADKIVLASVLGWKVIAKKGEFQIGDKCVYFEVDSILPKIPAYFILERYNFRVKTIRMRGVYSQGLALPFSSFPDKELSTLDEGSDLTELLGVTKYDPGAIVEKNETSFEKEKAWFVPLLKYAWFRKYVLPHLPKKEKGNFPTHLIAKSDETRIQNIPSILSKYVGQTFIMTEKLEGCSSLFGLEKKSWFRKTFYVCSRELRKLHVDKSVWWEIYNQEEMNEVLLTLNSLFPAKAWLIQGEIIGEKIQGNFYNIKGNQFYVYRLKKIEKDDTEIFYNAINGYKLLRNFGLNWVPILGEITIQEGQTVESILEMADGVSKLFPTSREGIVFSLKSDPTISFKAVSNKYLIEHDK